MYKDVLRDIDGVSIFPIISLLMFIVFFTIILVIALKYGKANETELSVLPLEDQSADSINNAKKPQPCLREI